MMADDYSTYRMEQMSKALMPRLAIYSLFVTTHPNLVESRHSSMDAGAEDRVANPVTEMWIDCHPWQLDCGNPCRNDVTPLA